MAPLRVFWAELGRRSRANATLAGALGALIAAAFDDEACAIAASAGAPGARMPAGAFAGAPSARPSAACR